MNLWAVGSTILFVTVLAWPNLAWELRPPFLWTNRAQWFLTNPARHWMRDPRSKWPHRCFLIFSPFLALYWLTAYVLTTPLRLINAVYFDVLLFWAVALRNGIADLVKPPYAESGYKYVLRWLYLFPWRLLRFLLKYPAAILQGLAMVLFDLLWPTLTLFHGSGDKEAKTIAGTGEWFAGTGNYVGTGIYFGLEQKVGEHYARSKRGPLVIIARVTLTLCRPVATLPDELRRRIGRDGGDINHGLRPPWVSIEHWRHDRRWYEFCLLQPSQFDPTKPWRVRPICTVGQTGPERLPGGPATWPNSRRGWIMLSGTLLLLVAAAFAYASFVGAFPPLAMANAFSLPVIQPWTCPDAPATRLEVGDRACVVGIGSDVLRVRSAPALDEDNVSAKIYQGAKMTIRDGPACADGYVWWKAQLEDGTVGWVAEGSRTNYFIEPCD